MNSTLFDSVETFQLYYTPLLVYFGTIGNCLSVYVFQSPKLRKLSSSCYLSALAVSDTVFLLALFTVWLTMVGVDIFNKTGACQIIVYLTGVCSFLSVWFVVAFTVERFVAVRYPLLRNSICTVQRARVILIALTIFALGLFTPLLLFADTRHFPGTPPLCTVQPLWQDAASAFNALDTLLTFIIPVLTIVILNTWISHIVWKLGNVRRCLTQRRNYIMKKGKRNDTSRKKYYSSNQKKVTQMLLLVSTVFLCFNLPSYIMRVLTYFIELQILSKNVDISFFATIQHICMQFFNTNFSINFILYCIGGVNFRRAVTERVCGRTTNHRRTETSIPITRTNSFSSYKSSRRFRSHSTTKVNLEMVHISNVVKNYSKYKKSDNV